MKRKIITIICAIFTSTAFADATGIYLGGGIGYANQNLSLNNISATFGSPALRLVTGYQLANWIGVELGYTYLSQTSKWNNIGAVSTTVYDLSFTPGFPLPGIPLTIFIRLGIDGVSSNLNNTWYNQLISNVQGDFEWGGGLKVDIPGSNTFVRAEFIDYGSTFNNNNSNLNVISSSTLITAGYLW